MSQVISVIVPVHNALPYLEECVLSVVGQTYGDWHMILVDDASSDGSAELIACYVRQYPGRITAISSGGRGVSAARNAGLDAAEGDYVFFLDADDTLTPDAFGLLMSIAEEHKSADIIAGQLFPGRHRGTTVLTGADEAIEATLYQRPLYHESVCAKLYKRHLFDNTRFVEGRRYEDLEITPRIYRQCSAVAVTDTQVYNYRCNSESFIHNWSQGRTDALWAADRIVAEFGKTHGASSLSRRFSAYFNVFNLATVNSRSEIALRCWEEIKLMRQSILHDGNSRSINRLAAFASYFGRKPMMLAAKIINKN